MHGDSSQVNLADMQKGASFKDKFKAELLQFCSHTSAHGLGHVSRSSNLLIQVAWFLFFLAGLAGITWQLSSIMIVYYAYPIHEVNKMTTDAVPFPDVTVCNIEPLNPPKAFALSADINSTIHEYRFIKLDKINALIKKNPNSAYLKIGRVSSTKGYFENQIPADSRLASHQLHDLIVGCRYLGQDCLKNKEEHFRFQPDGTYYNCYTFTATNIAPNATGVGPNVGLSLIFYLGTTSGGRFKGNFDPLSNVKQSSGVRVSIHTQGSLTSPLNEGFDITQGYSTAVGLRATKLTRKGHPYGNCSLARKHKILSQYSYTASACMLLHTQLHIHKRCGCLSVDLPVPGSLKDALFCGFYNFNDTEYIAHIECEQVAYYEFYGMLSFNEDICQPSCESYTYAKEISGAKWPSVRYYQSFFDTVIAQLPDRDSLRAYTELMELSNSSDFSDSTLIVDNFARLNVYFTSSDVILRSQEPSYDQSNLLSDMGGTIGLWAGLSFLTVLEVVVFSCRVVALPFSK